MNWSDLVQHMMFAVVKNHESSGVGEGAFPLSSDNERWRNLWELDLVEGGALTSEANGGHLWSAVSYT